MLGHQLFLKSSDDIAFKSLGTNHLPIVRFDLVLL